MLLRALLLSTAFASIASFAEPPAFSHKRHAAVAMDCTFCHKGAATQARSGFPAAALCRTCHPKQETPPIPSRRVYRLADFVFFSHARHADAKVQCATCHGNVNAQDPMLLFRSTKMADCVECHKQTKATIVCQKCHELGQ